MIAGWHKRNNVIRYSIFKLFNKRLVFSKESIERITVYYAKKAPFEEFIAKEFGENINAQLNKNNNMVEVEYLLEYDRKCFVEPRFGWLIKNDNTVFQRSLPYGISEITQLPHYIYYKRKKKIYLREALPLYYNWFNYWHFYNDIIGSLMVLDKLNFDKTIPIISPKRALNVSYVKDFFTTEYSKKWNWLFVDEMTYVQLQKAYVVKSFANVKEQFLLAANIFKTPERKTGNRKIFLNRDKKRGRNIINIDEILPVIKDFAFEIFDTDIMSVWEQKALFESASTVLAIHGAGLTNMFFRSPQSCTILEIFPKNKYPAHYYWLARELGFDYDCISGENYQDESFLLSKKKLNNFLKRHL